MVEAAHHGFGIGAVVAGWMPSSALLTGVPSNARLVIDAYRQHVQLTDEELDRLEAVMAIRPLYLTSFAYRRNIVKGWDEDALAFSDPGHMRVIAETVRDRLSE